MENLKSKTIRVAAFICLAAITVSVVSCGNEKPINESESTEVIQSSEVMADAEKTDMSALRQEISDGLSEKDFGGEKMNIAVNTFCQDGFFKEDQTGDVLDDAIYNRNRTVEERFNIELVYIAKHYEDTLKDIVNSVTAGDDEYQIVAEHAIIAGRMVTGKLLMNWYDVPNVDFSKPWWSPSNVNDLTVDGVCLLSVGDFALTTIGRTYCMVYDKVAAESYNMPDIYGLVYDGDWTIDKLTELTKDTYSDLNKNNTRDTEDFYGFSTSTASKIGTFLWAFDNPIYKKNKDDQLEMVVNTEKISAILEKLMSICWDNPDVYYDVNYKKDSSEKHYVSEDKFSKGTTIFASALLESGIKYFRDTENDYGIIPYPKWNEEQGDYHTIVDGGFSALAIPKTVHNIEMVGTVIEALCAETYKNVVPVYYDIALKEKGTRDETSKKMIDFVISKRIFDFGYVFDNWKGYGFKLEEMIQNSDSGFASMYASTEGAVKEHYKSVIECFTKGK